MGFLSSLGGGRGIGTLIGSGLGSMFGPAGTAIGGALGGGIGGAFGKDNSPAGQAQGQLNNEFRQVGGLSQFQAPGLQGMRDQFGAFQGPQSQAFNQAQQMALMDAQGQGPGQDLVRQQVGEQTNQGVANSMANLATNNQGAAGVLGARSQGANFANIAGQGQRAASQGGLQAMMQGRQQLGALSQADMQNQLQTQQMRQSGMLGAAGLQQQGALERQRQMGQRFDTIAGGANKFGGLANQEQMGMGSIIGAAGALFGGK